MKEHLDQQPLGSQTPKEQRYGKKHRDQENRQKDHYSTKNNRKASKNSRQKVSKVEILSTSAGAAFPTDWPVRVTVTDREQLEAVLEFSFVDTVFLDEASFSDSELSALYRGIRAAGKKAGLRFRRVEREPGHGKLPETVLLRSVDQLSILPELGSGISFGLDYTVYAYNHEAAGLFHRLGADTLTYPVELTKRECLELRRASDMATPGIHWEMLAYGRIPMMVSANCVRRTVKGCDHGNSVTFLTDRTGRQLPVRAYCRYCYNEIYNADPFTVLDQPESIRELRPDSIRLDFSTESGEEVRGILQGRMPLHFTRGHLKNGVL